MSITLNKIITKHALLAELGFFIEIFLIMAKIDS
jgi:hypothetical protein